MILLAHCSECYLSLGDLENAIVDARVALLLKSDSAKVLQHKLCLIVDIVAYCDVMYCTQAHYRLAKAVFLMGRVEEALSLVTNALQTHSTDMVNQLHLLALPTQMSSTKLLVCCVHIGTASAEEFV